MTPATNPDDGDGKVALDKIKRIEKALAKPMLTEGGAAYWIDSVCGNAASILYLSGEWKEYFPNLLTLARRTFALEAELAEARAGVERMHQQLALAPTVVFNGSCVDTHWWAYSPTVGNMSCIRCREFRAWDHPETVAYRATLT